MPSLFASHSSLLFLSHSACFAYHSLSPSSALFASDRLLLAHACDSVSAARWATGRLREALGMSAAVLCFACARVVGVWLLLLLLLFLLLSSTSSSSSHYWFAMLLFFCLLSSCAEVREAAVDSTAPYWYAPSSIFSSLMFLILILTLYHSLFISFSFPDDHHPPTQGVAALVRLQGRAAMRENRTRAR